MNELLDFCFTISIYFQTLFRYYSIFRYFMLLNVSCETHSKGFHQEPNRLCQLSFFPYCTSIVCNKTTLVIRKGTWKGKCGVQFLANLFSNRFRLGERTWSTSFGSSRIPSCIPIRLHVKIWYSQLKPKKKGTFWNWKQNNI